MSADLPPYPEYRDSGVPWVGDVPAHWEVLRTRYLLREVDRRSEAGAETHLSMSQKLGLVPASMIGQGTLVSASYAGGKLCQRDDLVLNRLKAHLGVFALSRQAGVISPDYTVLRKTGPMAMPYFEYVLRSSACRVELRRRAKGIVEGFWRLYTDDLYDIRLPTPPLDEQAAIVHFLEHSDRRIRRYIAAKKKLLALLDEQKRAIIHHAVTRGLDPSVRLERTGLSWLEEIPAHWEVRRLASIANVVDPNPSHRNPDYVDDGFPFISTVEFIGSDEVLVDTPRRVAESTVAEQERRCGFVKGSIAFSRKGTVGAVRVLPSDIRFALLDSVCVVNPGPRMDARFLYRFLGSEAIKVQCGAIIRGAALPQLSVGRVRMLNVLVPPLGEQASIITEIDSESRRLDEAIAKCRLEIGLLREYQTRLVTDVVTGHLDVREAATRLPDEVDEPESLRGEAPSEGDESEDEAAVDAAFVEGEA